MPYYLKCRYADGTYDNEYLVSFAAKERKNWCFARKKDVITELDNNGLVKVLVRSYGKYTSLVSIVEAYSNTMLDFSVKTEDITIKQ